MNRFRKVKVKIHHDEIMLSTCVVGASVDVFEGKIGELAFMKA
jgi:hypothetical protein